MSHQSQCLLYSLWQKIRVFVWWCLEINLVPILRIWSHINASLYVRPNFLFVSRRLTNFGPASVYLHIVEFGIPERMYMCKTVWVKIQKLYKSFLPFFGRKIVWREAHIGFFETLFADIYVLTFWLLFSQWHKSSRKILISDQGMARIKENFPRELN